MKAIYQLMLTNKDNLDNPTIEEVNELIKRAESGDEDSLEVLKFYDRHIRVSKANKEVVRTISNFFMEQVKQIS